MEESMTEILAGSLSNGEGLQAWYASSRLDGRFLRGDGVG